jgi:hypothetical protein
MLVGGTKSRELEPRAISLLGMLISIPSPLVRVAADAIRKMLINCIDLLRGFDFQRRRSIPAIRMRAAVCRYRSRFQDCVSRRRSITPATPNV